MDCGCGGQTFGAENAPAATDPFYWNGGTPAEAPASEPAKADKAPAAAKSTKTADK